MNDVSDKNPLIEDDSPRSTLSNCANALSWLTLVSDHAALSGSAPSDGASLGRKLLETCVINALRHAEAHTPTGGGSQLSEQLRDKARDMEARNEGPETELWNTSDIASYLQQSRKSVQNRLIHRPDFPEPIRGAERPKLWVKQDVLNYLLGDEKRSGIVPMRRAARAHR